MTDHETNEYMIYGPPGTGKTTTVSSQIRKAVQKVGADEIFVASFTRAAAIELAGRQLPIRPNQVGTLHSHCFRALGYDREQVAESHIDDWNSYVTSLGFPQYKIEEEDSAQSLDDSGNTAFASSDLFQRYNLHRAKLIAMNYEFDVEDRTTEREARIREINRRALEGITPDEIVFASLWDTWKADNNLVDFNGMLEEALHSVDRAPGNPSVGFFDEVQDFTALELAVVKKWGKHMSIVTLAGDDDQCIYAFKGADAKAFIRPDLPRNHKHVLNKSYRLPRQVQAFAQCFVENLSYREPKPYESRDFEGKLTFGFTSYAELEHTDTSLVRAIARHEREGKSVMFLATCGYMLEPLLRKLRFHGIPFHNPYKPDRWTWNPLGKPSKGVGMKDRILSFMRPNPLVWDNDARMWNGLDLQRWADVLKERNVFRDGLHRRDLALLYGNGYEIDLADLLRYFTDEALASALALDLTWWKSNLLEAKKSTSIEYIEKIAQKRGAKVLRDEPKVTVGTIHSVKGGQADVVYLFPDIPRMALERVSLGLSDESGEKKHLVDEVIRQMYVGMTRAREELVICNAAFEPSPMFKMMREAQKASAMPF